MRKDCDTCLHDEFGEKYCNDCYWANGKPPTKWEPAPFWTPDTNADRIRAMSDEELAKFIPDWSYTNACKCDELPYVDCNNECEKCVLEWLKLPAETEPAQNTDTCVCCGAIIPEGQMVCPNCLVAVKEDKDG